MILSECVNYDVIEERLRSAELGNYVSFGIVGRNAVGEEILSVSDISTDKSFVESLCERCNTLCLSPIHILDVVEDSI